MYEKILNMYSQDMTHDSDYMALSCRYLCPQYINYTLTIVNST